MENTSHSLLESLNSLSAEVKSITKRIEHLSDNTANDDTQKCIDSINNLIRELDHAVEKLDKHHNR